jgi:hypothetical protein
MLNGLLRLASYAAALFTLISTVHAEDGRRVFTGTLGNTPIVVELDTTRQDEVTGRYFYEKYRRDLALNGSLQGSKLTLVEGDSRYLDDKPVPTLKLEETAIGWQGEWQSPQGKMLPVKLAQAKIPAPTSNTLPFIAELPKTDTYEYLRLQGLQLKPAKKQSFMGYDLQWWTESESKISMFSVESGYAKEDQQRVNKYLLGRLWSEVISYHSCLLYGGQFAEFEQRAAATFLSPDVVSLDIFTSYNCGGAHPDFGSSSINLDVQTGELLKLKDVLWIGEPNSAASDENQQKVLVPWLIKQFTALYPNEMKKPAEDDIDCDYTDESVWGYSNWHFTPKGIYLKPYFARFQRSCDGPEWPVLPYSLVNQHLGAAKLQLPKG